MSLQNGRNFRALLANQWAKGHFLCVGLDSDYDKLPKSIKPIKNSVESSIDLMAQCLLKFNKAIIDATHDLVCAYKPNTAFYEAYGDAGFRALQETIAYILEIAPEVPIILDAKRGDIGNTNTGYVKEAFDYFQADAITVHPYLGSEALQPFLEKKDKGIIILCRTSNTGSGEIQNLLINNKPLYQIIAQQIAEKWNVHGNCSVVAGATYPEELKIIRDIIGDDMPILIPGIGAQGGDLEQTVLSAKNSSGTGMIISASRSIIFASNESDFADAAREEAITLNNAIQTALK